jgi:cell division septation protein DedD
MADEGLHEIQLNGKQLVFLFMASTVVAVVIFLCGVMVGRGVRAQRPLEALEASAEAAADPTAVAQTTLPAPSAPAASNSGPVASQETLTYPNRLEGQESPEETLKATPPPVSAKPAPAPAKVAPPTPKPAPVAATPSPAVSGEPAGNGFVVQVAAVNNRGEAETIAKRLAGKGYPSFVTTPPNGTPRMFRVRIGKYPTRREAETIAARLEKEDQFKPWITR